MADGKVVIQTELDTKPAKQQAQGLGSSLKGGLAKGTKVAATGMAAVGAAVTAASGAMVKATKATMEYGVEVNRNSQKLNMSKQGYQEWSYVLKRSGTSIDSLRMGMKKISTQIDEAKNGSKSATENFKRLGLSVDDLKGKSQEEVFSLMVQRLQGIKDTTERSAIANKFFGRSAQEMAGLLNKSGKDVEALKKQAHDLGLVLSDDAIKKTAEFRGKLTELQSAFEGLRNKMAVKFLPSLTQVTEGMSLLVQGKETDGLKKIENGIKGFSDTLLKTVPTLLKVAGGLVLSLSQAIVNNLPQLISTGSQLLISLVKGVVKMLPTAITMIIQSVQTLLSSLSAQLPTLLTTLVNGIFNALILLLSNVPNLIKVAISFVTSLVDAILQALPVFIERLPEIIGSIISAIISSIPMIISGLIQLVANIVTRLPEIIFGIIEAIPKMISQFLTALTDVDKITQWVKGLISMCIKIAQETPKMVAEFVKKIPSMIKQFVSAMIEKIGEWVSGLKSLVGKIIENMPNIIHAFVEWVKDLPARIVSWLSSLPERSNELGKKAFKFLYNGFVWMLNHSVDMTQHIIKWIQGGGPSRFAKKMQDLGVDIIKGIVAGALKASEECDKIGLMILKKVKDYFIIGSPSKLMKKEVGYWIGIGTADGIVDGFMKENPMAQINNAMASEIQASAGRLQTAINTSMDLNAGNLAGAVVEGIANSNMTIKIGEREMGRVVRSYN